MYLLFLLLLPSVVLPRKLSVEENERLKANCGAHYLKGSGMIPKSMGTGTPVESNTFPWIAAIKFTIGEWNYGCSAVQLSSRHVLTAAHCVLDMVDDEKRNSICKEVRPKDRSREFFSRIILAKLPPENFTIYASSSCDDYPFDCKNDEIMFKTTESPHVHEEYDPCTGNSDLALVQLDHDIPSEVGSPICMIEKGEHLAEELTVVGYGNDPHHPIPEGSGLNRLEMMKIDSKDVEEVKLGRKLVTSLKKEGICKGDSGGPLVQLDQEGKYSVIGISSTFGPSLCSMPLPHGSRRVSKFIDLRYYTDWICTLTGICPIQQLPSNNGRLESPFEWLRTQMKLLEKSRVDGRR